MRRAGVVAAVVAAVAAVTVLIANGGGQDRGPLGSSLDIHIGPTATATPTPTPPACTGADVTTGTFAARVSGASSGNVLCLTTGNYGTFSGTGSNLPLTITAKAGASPSMSLDLNNGDSGLVVDGGRETWNASTGLRIEAVEAHGVPGPSFTLRDSLVQETAEHEIGQVWIDGPTTASILIQHNRFTHAGEFNNDADNFGTEAAIKVETGTGTVIDSNVFHDMWADGVKWVSDADVTRNKFINISDFPPWDASCALGSGGCVHSDAVQSGSDTTTVVGNIIDTCQQGITGFDPMGSPTVKHNVIRNCAGHSWTYMFSHTPGPTVVANTLVAGQAAADCSASSGKASQYPSESSTTPTMYNNLFASGLTLASGGYDCAPTRSDHNLTSGSGVVYAGGTPAQSWTMAQYCLAAGSTGLTSADDGGQVGACWAGDGFNSATDGPPTGEEY